MVSELDEGDPHQLPLIVSFSGGGSIENIVSEIAIDKSLADSFFKVGLQSLSIEDVRVVNNYVSGWRYYGGSTYHGNTNIAPILEASQDFSDVVFNNLVMGEQPAHWLLRVPNVPWIGAMLFQQQGTESDRTNGFLSYGWLGEVDNSSCWEYKPSDILRFDELSEDELRVVKSYIDNLAEAVKAEDQVAEQYTSDAPTDFEVDCSSPVPIRMSLGLGELYRLEAQREAEFAVSDGRDLVIRQYKPESLRFDDDWGGIEGDERVAIDSDADYIFCVEEYDSYQCPDYVTEGVGDLLDKAITDGLGEEGNVTAVLR